MQTDPVTDETTDTAALAETNNFASDIAVAAFFLIWAIVGWTSLLSDENLFSDLYAGADPGPTLLPIIVLSVLSLGGAALAASAFLSRRPASKSDNTAQRLPKGFKLALALFVSIATFPFFMTHIGYLPTTFIFVFVWAFGLTHDPMQAPLRNGMIAALAAGITSLLIYACFDILIGVRFP